MSKRIRAVRFDHYGPVDVLRVEEVEAPEPGESEVLIDVIATSINPGEIMLREGMFHTRAPAKFPSGQGSDFAGRVAAPGAAAGGTACSTAMGAATSTPQSRSECALSA